MLLQQQLLLVNVPLTPFQQEVELVKKKQRRMLLIALLALLNTHAAALV